MKQFYNIMGWVCIALAILFAFLEPEKQDDGFVIMAIVLFCSASIINHIDNKLNP